MAIRQLALSSVEPIRFVTNNQLLPRSHKVAYFAVFSFNALRCSLNATTSKRWQVSI